MAEQLINLHFVMDPSHNIEKLPISTYTKEKNYINLNKKQKLTENCEIIQCISTALRDACEDLMKKQSKIN